MGYAQRFLIGVFLIVSAYEIYGFGPQNHPFQINWISKVLNTAQGDENTSNFYQKILAILIFCSGVALIVGYGLRSAIISQSFLTFLSIFDQTKGTSLNSLHWIILNLAVLIIIIINHRSIDSEDIVCFRQKQIQGLKQHKQ